MEKTLDNVMKGCASIFMGFVVLSLIVLLLAKACSSDSSQSSLPSEEIYSAPGTATGIVSRPSSQN